MVWPFWLMICKGMPLPPQMSLEAVAALCSAMTKLDVGQVGVCGFGDEPSLILPFNEPFTSTAGARVVQHFTFQQQNTDIVK